MEQIAKMIEELKKLIESLPEQKDESTAKLKKELEKLEEFYEQAKQNPEAYKEDLIKAIAKIETKLLFNHSKDAIRILLQNKSLRIEQRLQEVIDYNGDSQQKGLLLAKVQKEYERLIEENRESKEGLNFLGIKNLLAEATISVIGAKINAGIEIDLKEEIDSKYTNSILLYIQSKLKFICEQGEEEQKIQAEALLEEVNYTNLHNFRKGKNKNILHDEEFMRSFLECIGINYKEKGEPKPEYEGVLPYAQYFREYRAKKLDEYRMITGIDNIDPGEEQITIIDVENRVIKLGVDKNCRAKGDITDVKKGKTYQFPVDDNGKIIPPKGITQKVYTKQYKEFNNIICYARAVIFGKGIKAFASDILTPTYNYQMQDIIFNEDMKVIYKTLAAQSIKEFIAPPDLEEVREGVFRECCYLRVVQFNDKLRAIYPYAFSETRISEVKIPKSTEILHVNAFRKTSMQELVVPKGTQIVTEPKSSLKSNDGHIIKVTVEGENQTDIGKQNKTNEEQSTEVEQIREQIREKNAELESLEEQLRMLESLKEI